jgi:hypothetical protein
MRENAFYLTFFKMQVELHFKILFSLFNTRGIAEIDT